VIEQVARGGTHIEGPFRRPFSGALSFLHVTPGVPLRSTPGFILPHPSGALALTASCFSWCAEFDQRRRREGVEPGTKRSGAPGGNRVHIFKPLTRGGRKRVWLTDRCAGGLK
jgi:hypothetical protein